jgi:hypothetical protein
MLTCTAGCMRGGWLVQSSNADDQQSARVKRSSRFRGIALRPWVKVMVVIILTINTTIIHGHAQLCVTSSVTRPGLNVVN